MQIKTAFEHHIIPNRISVIKKWKRYEKNPEHYW